MAPNDQAPAPAPQPRVPATPAAAVHVGQMQPAPAVAIGQVTTQPAIETPVAAAPASGLILPLSVVSRSDIARSLRELTTLDDFFHQASIRGTKVEELPTLSKALDNVATANGLNLLKADDRSQLKEFLARLKAKVPVVHMSFPSEASDPFIAKVLEWFRREVHPHVVLHIGLQPELAAGCTVRTTNKVFDFSLRNRFEQSKQKLISALEASAEQALEEAKQATPQPVTPSAPAAQGVQQ